MQHLKVTQRSQRASVIPCLLLCLLSLLLLWRCQYSLANSDETLYLALVHRLWAGDRPLIDELNKAQFYAQLTLPLYRLYRAVIPSGIGVFLAFRCFYVLFSALIAMALYLWSVRCGTNRWVCLCAAALALLYARANICGFSYYNLSLHNLLLSALLIHVAINSHPSSRLGKLTCLAAPFLSGTCFALSVMCCPTMVLFLPPYLFATSRLLPGKTRYVVCGGMTVVVVYLAILLSQMTPSQAVSSFITLLDDPEHQEGPLGNISHTVEQLPLYLQTFVPYLTSLGIVEELVARKFNLYERALHWFFRTIYHFLAVVLCLHTALLAKTSPCFVISLPIFILLSPSVIHSFLRRDGEVTLGEMLYIGGIVLSLAYLLGSNTRLDAMTTGLTLSCMGGLLCWGDEMGEAVDNRILRLAQAVSFAAFATVALVVYGAHRVVGVYRDAPFTELTARIDRGPSAGLITTQSHRDEYYGVLQAIQGSDGLEQTGGIFVSKILPWGYLASTRRCASPTAWRVPLSDSRLMPYYLDRGHDFPRVVIVLAPEVGSFDTSPFNNHVGDKAFNANDQSGPFYEWLVSNASINTELSNQYATVYEVKE